MATRFGLFVGVSASMLVGASAVQAADVVPPKPYCSESLLVQAGGLVDGTSWKVENNFTDTGSTNWLGGFGEAGAQVQCGDPWGVQLDAAYYYFGASNDAYDGVTNTDNLSEVHGHIGGVAYKREADSYMLGLGVSDVMWYDHITYPLSPKSYNDLSQSLLRVGPLGQLFINDQFTLGGGAFYLTGNTGYTNGSTGQSYSVTGYDGNLFAKFYPNKQWALMARVDMDHMHFVEEGVNYSSDIYGQVGTLEAEYLIPNSSVSVFGGGRLAHQHYIDTYQNMADQSDIQGFAGFRIALGSTPITSLRDRDRNGLIDNTSVTLEKIPDMLGGPLNVDTCAAGTAGNCINY